MYKAIIYIVAISGLSLLTYHYRNDIKHVYNDVFSVGEELKQELKAVSEEKSSSVPVSNKIDVEKETQKVIKDVHVDSALNMQEVEKILTEDIIKRFERYNLILQNLNSLVLKVSLRQSYEDELQYLIAVDLLDLYRLKMMLDEYDNKYISPKCEDELIFPSQDSWWHSVLGRMFTIEKTGRNYVDSELDKAKILFELGKVHEIVYSKQFIKQILSQK